CGKDFPKLAKLRIHLERKNLCKLNIPNSITNTKCPALQTPLQQNLAINQIPIQTHVLIGDLIQLDNTPSSPIQNIPKNDTE
ncbi:35217_t:CDS:1, partial [Racocetra persica]